MKIASISRDQEARFGEWVREWVKLGLSTEPADFDKAQDAALRFYQLTNLKRPMVILRMSSPYGATLGGILAWGFLRAFYDKKTRAKVWSQDMSITNCGPLVAEVEIEFDAPPREVLVNGTIAEYREQQKKIRADAEQKCMAYEQRIGDLLCLEHKPEPEAA